MKVLLVDQGRATSSATMGHVRVRHALAAGMGSVRRKAEIEEVDVPAYTRAQRTLVRHLPGTESGGLRSLRWHLLRSWLGRRTIAERVRDGRPDVVHVTTDQVSLLFGDLWRKVPIVLSNDILTTDWLKLNQEVPQDAPTPGYLRPIEALERRALERAPLTIAWTETVRRSAEKLAPSAELAVLHPGLDLEVYRPPATKPSSGPVRVLFVGGRWQKKGGPELVSALGPHLGKNVRLDVVTPEDVECVPGMQVHQGAPGSSTVADLFARADVFCLPTHCDAVPWVVLEAMACGVPVISTSIGSIPEMVGDAGLLVRPGDSVGLHAALRTLLEDRALRARMGEAGRTRTEAHYDARANTPMLIELLVGAAASHAGIETVPAEDDLASELSAVA